MDPEVTEDDINNHFGSIGIIKKDKRTQKPKIWIYRNKETNTGKGECTITYDDPSAASSAIDWFDGKDFNGMKIKVSLAQRNNWQPKGGRGGGFGGKISESAFIMRNIYLILPSISILKAVAAAVVVDLEVNRRMFSVIMKYI